MADLPTIETEPRSRRRHGPPPRLYVISRCSPLPWLQIRRVSEPDRVRLALHLGRLVPAPAGGAAAPDTIGSDAIGIVRFCATLDLERSVIFAAIAGNQMVAAAAAVRDPAGGTAIAVTIDPAWRKRGLRRMLAGQVADALPPEPEVADPAAGGLGSLVLDLGGRLMPAAMLRAAV